MNDILKLYLYENSETKGNFLDSSEHKEDYLKLISPLYVINPSVNVIPSGLNYVCAKNQNNETVDIIEVNDPYNQDMECLRFIVWTQPAPYSSKMRVWKNSIASSLKITLGDISELDKDYKELFFSPLYVLLDPRTNYKRIGDEKNGNFKIINNEPVFLFRNEYGFCIPYDKGVNLSECVKNYQKHEQPTILVMLKDINERRMRRFRKLFIITLFTILVIFIILVVNKKT